MALLGALLRLQCPSVTQHDHKSSFPQSIVKQHPLVHVDDSWRMKCKPIASGFIHQLKQVVLALRCILIQSWSQSDGAFWLPQTTRNVFDSDLRASCYEVGLSTIGSIWPVPCWQRVPILLFWLLGINSPLYCKLSTTIFSFWIHYSSSWIASFDIMATLVVIGMTPSLPVGCLGPFRPCQAARDLRIAGPGREWTEPVTIVTPMKRHEKRTKSRLAVPLSRYGDHKHPFLNWTK